MQGILSHGLVLKEIPSLSLPFYFGIMIPVLLLVSLLSLDLRCFIATFVLYIIPSLAVLYKVRRKNIDVADVLRLLLLIQFYFFARTLAIVKRM